MLGLKSIFLFVDIDITVLRLGFSVSSFSFMFSSLLFWLVLLVYIIELPTTGSNLFMYAHTTCLPY